MKPEGLLPCLQHTAADPYPESDGICPHAPTLSPTIPVMYFNPVNKILTSNHNHNIFTRTYHL
jgi:hypothetical protein